MWYWKKSCIRIASLFVKCSFLRLHRYRQQNFILGHFTRKMCSLLETQPYWYLWLKVIIQRNGTQNAFMLFFASCLWKSLGGLIALDRTLGKQDDIWSLQPDFCKWCLCEHFAIVFLWGLNNVWVCGTGVVQRRRLWQVHSTRVACPSLPAQLHNTNSQLDCPNSVTSSLFTLGKVI